MEQKKLLASVAALAMTANFAFAGLSLADTGETTIDPGSYTLSLEDSGYSTYNGGTDTLTFYKEISGDCDVSNGNITASATQDKNVCAGIRYTLQDTVGNSDDIRILSMRWNDDSFSSTSSSSTVAITGGGGGIGLDMEHPEDGTSLTWTPTGVNANFDLITITEFPSVITGSYETILEVDEGTGPDANSAYTVTGDIRFDLNVPAGTPSETFTTTVEFSNT